MHVDQIKIAKHVFQMTKSHYFETLKIKQSNVLRIQ